MGKKRANRRLALQTEMFSKTNYWIEKKIHCKQLYFLWLMPMKCRRRRWGNDDVGTDVGFIARPDTRRCGSGGRTGTHSAGTQSRTGDDHPTAAGHARRPGPRDAGAPISSISTHRFELSLKSNVNGTAWVLLFLLKYFYMYWGMYWERLPEEINSTNGDWLNIFELVPGCFWPMEHGNTVSLAFEILHIWNENRFRVPSSQVSGWNLISPAEESTESDYQKRSI